ncbi:MAG: M23 family metallopeptidase [Actinomycetes bacterium]
MSRRFAFAAVSVLALSVTLIPATVATAAPAPMGVVVRASVPNFPGILKAGSHGAAVTAVQKGLLAHGYKISGLTLASSRTKFGVLGAATMATIMRYKKAHNLGPSFAVGPKTYASITGWKANTGGSSGGGTSGGSTGGTTARCGSYTGHTCKKTATGGRFCPTIGAYIGDGFGANRGSHSHQGVDLMSVKGRPIYAVEGGVVAGAKMQSNGALAITIKGQSGNVWYYGHQSVNLVSDGDTVKAGQLIGRVGDTGAPGAFHLHFEYRPGSPGDAWFHSVAVDPVPLIKKLCF